MNIRKVKNVNSFVKNKSKEKSIVDCTDISKNVECNDLKTKDNLLQFLEQEAYKIKQYFNF